MATACWIGLDPGAKRSGLILRYGDQCLGWRVIERHGDESEIGVGPRYWDDITEQIAFMVKAQERYAVTMAVPLGGLAVEGVRKPGGFVNGKRMFAQPLDLMGLAATWAAIMARFPGAVIVPPGGNGSGLLAGYPEQVVTAAERRHGVNREALKGSKESHARSAWDVAGTAALTQRGAA